MTNKSHHILILEDNPDDAKLVQFELQEAGLAFTAKVVMTEEDYVRELMESCPDLILSDYNLPLYNGALALSEAKRRCPDTPFILVTGAIGEDHAIEILTQGAKDYVLKSRLQQRLVPAVWRALAEAEERRARKQAEEELREAHRTLEKRVKERTAELQTEIAVRKQAEEALLESEEKFRTLFENANEAIFVSQDKKLIFFNPATILLLGYSAEEIESRSFVDFIHPDDRDMVINRHIRRIKGEEDIPQRYSFRIIRRDGNLRWVELNAVLINWKGKPAVQNFLTDITGRKQAEEALLLNEERLRFAIEGAKDGLWDINLKTNSVFISPRSYEILGYKPDEIQDLENTWTDLVHPEDISLTMETLTNYFKRVSRRIVHKYTLKDQPAIFEIEQRLKMKSGEWKWVLSRGKVVQFDKEGNPERITGTHTDITNRKRAEETLRRSEEKYRLLADHTTDIIWLVNMNLETTYISPNVEKLRGFTPQEIMDSPPEKYFTPESFKKAYKIFTEELPKIEADPDYNSVQSMELEFYRKDGTTFWAETTFSVIRDVGGKPMSILGEGRDITERKRAGEALEQSEKKFKVLSEKSFIGIYIIQDAQMVYVNPAFARMFGYSPEEIIGILNPKNLIHPDDIQVVMRQMQERLEEKIELRPNVYKAIKKDGSLIYIEAYGILIDYQGRPAIMGTMTDITARKQAEQDLRESEEQYRTLFENVNEAIFIGQYGKLTFFNPVTKSLFGYTDDEIISKPFSDFIYPDDREMIVDRHIRRLKGEDVPNHYSFRILRKNGDVRWVEISAVMINWQGNPATLNFLSDITERIKAEETLRDLENFARSTVNALSAHLAILDDKGTIIAVNNAWQQFAKENAPVLTGLVEGANYLSVCDNAVGPSSDGAAQFAAGLRAVLQGLEEEYLQEYPCHSPTEERWFIGRVTRFLNKGTANLVVAHENITERKQVEKALWQSEEKYRNLIDNANEAIFVAQDGMPVFFNPMLPKIFGYEVNEFKPKPFTDVIHPDDLDAVIDRYDKKMKGENIPFRYSFRIMNKDGSFRWIDLNSVLISWEGKPATLNFLTDITERKQSEMELAESQALTEAIVDSTSDMIWSVDPQNFGLLTYNQSLIDNFIEGSGIDIKAGMRPEDIFPTGDFVDKWRCFYQRALAEGPYTTEYDIFAGTKTLQLTFNLLKRNDKIFGISVFGKDITERKKAENELKLSEARLLQAQTVAKIGSWETDLLNFNVVWSEETYCIFELDSSNFPASHQAFLEFVHPDDRAKVDAAFLASLEKDTSNEIEHRIITAKGNVKFVEERWRIYHDDQRKLLWAVGTCQDITERKRVDEELFERESKLKALFENTGYAISLAYKGVQILGNPAFVELFGYKDATELEGRPVIETIAPEERNRIGQYVADRVMGGEAPDHYETKGLRRDGSIFDMEVRISKYLLNNEIYTVGFQRDITSRKRAEEELRISREQYRSLVENINDVIFMVDLQETFTYVSPVIESLSGYTVSELEGLPFSHFVHPDDLPGLIESFKQTASGIKGAHEFRVFCKTGAMRWVVTRSRLIAEKGNPPVIMGIMTDITDRKNAEDALRYSKAQLDLAMHAANIGIWYWDLINKKCYFDNQVCHMLGIDASTFSGTEEDLFKAVYPDDVETIKVALSRTIKQNIIYKAEYRVIWKDLSVHHISARGLLVHDQNGRPARINGIIWDITEYKQAEEERRILEERLQRAEKMEALGLLAGGVAHDLNNVLGIVVGYSEMLLNDIDESSPMRDDMLNIMDGGQRAAAIVQDLLALARRGVSGRKVLNLNRVILDYQKSAELEKLFTDHPSIKVKTDLEADLLNISASPVHLGKTLFNLISNACEAMPKGGSLTIRTANQYLDKPIYGYDEIREGDYVVLSVTDTGEGIPQSNLKRIFEPFYTKKTMGRSGTGLGLAVVWGTVKDHQGYINVQSEEGRGSTFALFFPVTRQEIKAETSSLSVSEYMGKGESILVVDDIKSQRDLATAMLKKLKYKVENVASGEEAIEYLKKHKVDLLVLDMIMDPGMDGLDTYKSVLTIHPQQKAIIVSGFSESDRVNAAHELGAGAYVKKPYVQEKLGIAVKKELEGK